LVLSVNYCASYILLRNFLFLDAPPNNPPTKPVIPPTIPPATVPNPGTIEPILAPNTAPEPTVLIVLEVFYAPNVDISLSLSILFYLV